MEIMNKTNITKVLIIEPFYGGSHKVLIDTISSKLPFTFTLVKLPAKKWHWRARCAPLMLFNLIPEVDNHRVLFCSSVLSLAELLGIRPDLQVLKKIVYFHENQLIYPVQDIKQRDYQYCYNQITTCLAADLVVFNSNFNFTSFMDHINKVVNILPDFKMRNLQTLIGNKCTVLYFPVEFPLKLDRRKSPILHILWPHRWEFDKGPDDFFQTLFKLKENSSLQFKISILGESFADNPPVFEEAKSVLKNEILHFGYLESREDYFEVLNEADVVVSTAKHEFFGVSMLEAAYCGCYPIAPNSLVYPEIYPGECLYGNLQQLFNKLKLFCLTPNLARESRKKLALDFEKYSVAHLIPSFRELFA